jgi:copper homeostasis protein
MKEKLETMNRDDFKFEICANSVESCLAAQEGGANRVELCAGIPEGGTTPSYGEIKVARKLLNETKLHVIIRPRGGDFLYTPLEIERMEEDIRLCRELGVDGICG